MTKKVIQDKPISPYHHFIDNACWEQTMYQLSPAPKKLPYDTRIRLCLERKNFYHLRCFLHDYEKSLNGMAFSCCMRYDMPHYFGDVKATIVMALTEALHRYKPDTGVPFLAFAKFYVGMPCVILSGSTAGCSVSQTGRITGSLPRQTRCIMQVWTREKARRKALQTS